MELTNLDRAELINDIHTQLDSLTHKAYEEVGLKTPEAIQYIADIVLNHESGCSSRAIIIYIKGWLLRMNKSFSDIKNNPETLQAFLTGVTSSSSISRATPLSIVIQAATIGHVNTILDIGCGGGQAGQILLAPQHFDRPFFDKYRASLKPSNRIHVEKVYGVDPQTPSFPESTQIYTGASDKMDILRDLNTTNFGKRYERIPKPIQEVTLQDFSPKDLQGTVVLMVNNLLYQLTESTAQEVKNSTDNLAAQIRELPTVNQALIVHMGAWTEFTDTKPDITLPFDHSRNTPPKPLINPAFIEIGDNFSTMNTVAILDGATGKPFLCEKKAVLVFHQFDGNEILILPDEYSEYLG